MRRMIIHPIRWSSGGLKWVGCGLLWVMPRIAHRLVLRWVGLYLIKVIFDSGLRVYAWSSECVTPYKGVKYVYRLEDC